VVAISPEEETLIDLESSSQEQSWPRVAFTESYDRSFEMKNKGRFFISNISGQISVTTWNRSEVRIQATKVSSTRDEENARKAFDNVEIDINERNGNVSVKTEYSAWHRDRKHRDISVSVYYEITLPVEVESQIQSVSGHISVSNLNGAVTANSVSGRVRLRDIGHDILAKSVSGDVDVRSSHGDAEVKSVSGRIKVDEKTGNLDAHTTSREITLRDIEAHRMRAKSTCGAVEFSGPILENGRYDITTVGGRIKLTIPDSATFLFRAKSKSGHIDMDFPVTINGSNRWSREERQSVQGTVNGGELT